MNNTELLILNICFKDFRKGDYSIDADDLLDILGNACAEDELELLKIIDNLWEENYLESSNGRYYLTDKSLKFLKENKYKNNSR
jgi:hypothetical protein